MKKNGPFRGKQNRKAAQWSLHVLCFLLLAAVPAPSNAQRPGSVLIWPVKLEIEPQARAAALWLENPGSRAITLQVQVYSWTQDDGRDRYAEQDEVLGTPAVITIEPRDRQLVRLTRMSVAAVSTEKAYRVIVDEIPTHKEAGKGNASISFRMRYSLPLFSYGHAVTTAKDSATSRPELSWQIVDTAEGKFLEIRNEGFGHARLTQVAVSHGGERREVAAGLLGYVLPGATMVWPLQDVPTTVSELTATVNGDVARIIPRQAK